MYLRVPGREESTTFPYQPVCCPVLKGEAPVSKVLGVTGQICNQDPGPGTWPHSHSMSAVTVCVLSSAACSSLSHGPQTLERDARFLLRRGGLTLVNASGLGTVPMAPIAHVPSPMGPPLAVLHCPPS